jgi:hypothetical protein
MSQPCREIAPLLYRVAEADASPDEAMRTARHLSDCTACRILLAREVRLASMLEEGLSDPLQVGEDFVREVMENLPKGPPRPPRPRRSRRMLKLASIVGWIPLVPLVASAPGVAARIPAVAEFKAMLPGFEAPMVDGFAEGALRVGGVLMLVLDRLASGLSLPVELLPSGLLATAALLALVPLALAAGLTSAGACGVALRVLFRST